MTHLIASGENDRTAVPPRQEIQSLWKGFHGWSTSWILRSEFLETFFMVRGPGKILVHHFKNLPFGFSSSPLTSIGAQDSVEHSWQKFEYYHIDFIWGEGLKPVRAKQATIKNFTTSGLDKHPGDQKYDFFSPVVYFRVPKNAWRATSGFLCLTGKVRRRRFSKHRSHS